MILVPTAQAAGVYKLPAPTEMLAPGDFFNPVRILGLTVHPENPLEFGFIIDFGDEPVATDFLQQESRKLIKYFLAALTIPEDDMWVNLSPYEKERIIADDLGRTELGRDMLGQDYVLKQLTSSMMYPEDELGGMFWKRVYDKAFHLYGKTDIPMNTFNKIWIVPDSAEVFEAGRRVFITGSRLKVMLEEDFLALKENADNKKFALDNMDQKQAEVVSGVTSDVVREVLIPEIEWEVNYGQHFAKLRQIYHAMILASWFKQTLKESLLAKVYVNQNKTKGVENDDPDMKEKIYQQYVTAFKEGVYNYIREDMDPATNQMIPRKYFSGGLTYDVMAQPGFLKHTGLQYNPNATPLQNKLAVQDALKNMTAEQRAGVLKALENARAAEFLVSLVEEGSNAQAEAVENVENQAEQMTTEVVAGSIDEIKDNDNSMLSKQQEADILEFTRLNWRGRNLNAEKKKVVISAVSDIINANPDLNLDNIMAQISRDLHARNAQLMMAAVADKQRLTSQKEALAYIAYVLLDQDEKDIVDSQGTNVTWVMKLAALSQRRAVARGLTEQEKMRAFQDRFVNRAGEVLIDAISGALDTEDSDKLRLAFDQLMKDVGFEPAFNIRVNNLYDNVLDKPQRRMVDRFGQRLGITNLLKIMLMVIYAGLNEKETRLADELSAREEYKGDKQFLALRMVRDLRDVNEREAQYNDYAKVLLNEYFPASENLNTLSQMQERIEAYNLLDEALDFVMNHKEELQTFIADYEQRENEKAEINKTTRPAVEKEAAVRRIDAAIGRARKNFIDRMNLSMDEEIGKKTAGEIRRRIINKMVEGTALDFEDALFLLFSAQLDQDAYEYLLSQPGGSSAERMAQTIDYLSREKAKKIKLDYKNKDKNRVLELMIPLMLTLEEAGILEEFESFVKEIGLQPRETDTARYYNQLTGWKKQLVDQVVTLEMTPDDGKFKDSPYSRVNALEYLAVSGLTDDALDFFELQTNKSYTIGVRLKRTAEYLTAETKFPTRAQWMKENIAATNVRSILSKYNPTWSDEQFDRLLNVVIRDAMVVYRQNNQDHIMIHDQVAVMRLGEDVVADIHALDKKGEFKALGITFTGAREKQVLDYLTVASLTRKELDFLLTQPEGSVDDRLKEIFRSSTEGQAAARPTVIRRRKAADKPGNDNAQMAMENKEPLGGIDLDAALLDLQIRRNDNGVPLPLTDQPIGNMKIEGFIPVIIDVTPIQSIPMLLGMAGE